MQKESKQAKSKTSFRCISKRSPLRLPLLYVITHQRTFVKKWAFFILCFTYLFSAEKGIISNETILAIVNGNAITTALTNANFDSFSEELKQLHIERLIDQEIAIEFALASDIVKTDKFHKDFEHIMKMGGKYSLTNEKDANSLSIQKRLENINPLEQEVLRSKKGLFAFDKLLDAEASKRQPREKDLQEFYEDNFHKYNTPELHEIYTILVANKDSTKTITEQLKKSNSVFETFRGLASQYSIAPSKDNNGYLGDYDLSQTAPILAQEIKELKVGEFSREPFKTDFGYQILYLSKIYPKQTSTFKQAKAKINRDFLMQTVTAWAFDKIEVLKKNAKIKIVHPFN